MRLGLWQLLLILLLILLLFGNFEKLKIFLKQQVQKIKSIF